MYKINKKRITKGFYLPSIILILLISFCIFMMCITITSGDYYGIVVVLILSVFMYFCIKSIVKRNNKLKLVEYLEKNGKLIKNLPFDIIKKVITDSDGGSDTYLYYALVKYKLDDKETELISEVYHNKEEIFNNKYIDLLYDEKDTSNYYLEFNIEEVGEK